MSATVADTQVRTYLDAVKAELDDLREDDRDELLEDLEEHLLEVAAEDDGTLEQRLGPPASYAEELRASAGLPSRDQTLTRGATQRVAQRLARSSVWRSAVGVMETSQFRSLRAFAKELAPGWWVLRGYLGVVALAQVTGGVAQDDFPIPYMLESRAVGAMLVIGGILLSVWFGRRGQRGTKGRLFSVALSIAVVVVAIGAMSGWDTGAYAYYEEQTPNYPGFLAHADQTPIANICPYSTDGKLLSGVLLFDQGGRPISNTHLQLPNGPELERPGPAILNAYPQALNVVEGYIDIPDPATGTTHVEKRLTPLTCPPSIAPVVSPSTSPGTGAVPSPSATR